MSTSTSNTALAFILCLIVCNTSSKIVVPTLRWCAQCFELNCPEDKNEALLSATKEWAMSQLRIYYDVANVDSGGPRLCDVLSDPTEWKEMMATDSHCARLPTHFPTCSAGRFEIKSYSRQGDTEAKLICKTKIFGCAKFQMLKELGVRNATISASGTFSRKNVNGKLITTYHTMKMLKVITCPEADYCVKEVTVAGDEECSVDKAYFTIGIIGGVVAGIFGILIFGAFLWMCRCKRCGCTKANVDKS